MDAAYFALGGVVLVVAAVDILWTTLWVQGGAGPVTARLMTGVWRTMRRLFGRNRRALTLSGPVVLVASLGAWVALLWGEWTLVFAGAEDPLVDTIDAGPVSWAERVYFVGYAFFTLGNGDFAPNDGVWQVATVFTTANGMLFVTLIVTYVLSVLDAVTQKRAVASQVSGLGAGPTEIALAGWDGEEFDGLELPLNSIASELDVLTANHKAYPILHFFHSERAKNAPTVTIAVLDDLLTLLRFGVPDRERPNEVVVGAARSSVESYLETLKGASVEPADRSPPAPALRPLREADVPTASDEAFAAALDDEDERRRWLLGVVESDYREWPEEEEGEEG